MEFYSNQQIVLLRLTTINTYYFFVTIWYKIENFLNWIVFLFKAFKIFIETRNFKQASNEYEEDNPYKEKYQEEAKEHFKQENFYKESNKREEPKAKNTKNLKKKKLMMNLLDIFQKTLILF